MFKNRKVGVLFISVILISMSIFMLTSNFMPAQGGRTRGPIDKFLTVLRYVQLYYVEDVDWQDAIGGAINGMLQKLDPHSVYIPKKEFSKTEENFNAHYEGIGIYFDVIDNSVLVVSPIVGSPADKVGLLAGDRIVEIDGKSTYGITRDDVPKKLKGPKGTHVKVKVIREGLDEPLDIEITRDVIPINTVTTAFMLDKETGYILVNRFAATTNTETMAKMMEMEKKGMKQLILDLRGNPGGYLNQAVELAALFLPDDKLIVYTEGRGKRRVQEFHASMSSRSSYRKYPLIILVDRGSASASEIVAGAIQDHDRGLIVGTRSFGKGLVQSQFELPDSSAVRITTAKYFTPSGRCIQRSYKHKNTKQYYLESMVDTSNTAIDSTQVFHTVKGRVVYGGGGIIPDVIVHQDTNYLRPKYPTLYNKISIKRLYLDYATHYVKTHKLRFKNTGDFFRKFEMTDKIMNDFYETVHPKVKSIHKDKFTEDWGFHKKILKAEIARAVFGWDAFYEVLKRYDNQVNEARKYFGKAKQFSETFK